MTKPRQPVGLGMTTTPGGVGMALRHRFGPLVRWPAGTGVHDRGLHS